MKINKMKMFVLSLLSLANMGMTVHAQVKPSALEYWLDGRFAERTNVPTTGNLTQSIDVSLLRPGIHTLEMRVGDTRGRWGAPVLRYFLKGGPSMNANQLATYEYCIDGNWSKAVSGQLNEELALDIDVSDLREGVHTLQLHVSDQQGRMGQTVVRYFVVTGEDPSQRALTAYRYWVDDYSKATEGATSTGELALDIDVSQLCKGIHTVGYQVADNMGHWSAPRLHYFLIPDRGAGDDELTAYEYWFNRGPRTRVEMGNQKTLELTDVMIEVKDVIPNRIPADYSFDVSTEKVSCHDDVFFGMQVFNGADRGSGAVLSETFPMTLPVNPHFIALAGGEERIFAAPTAGLMQGFKTVCAVGDSLIYTLAAQGVKTDFYDQTGHRLEAEWQETDMGETVYTIEAATTLVYALVYGASDVMNELTIALDIPNSVGISDVASGWHFSASKRALHLTCPKEGRVSIVNASGVIVADQWISVGQTTFALPSGIYIVRTANGAGTKVVVP